MKGSPILRMQLPCLQIAAALLSPFLVSWLQFLSSIPQEDIVLFLRVVVLVALGESYSERKIEQGVRPAANNKHALALPPLTSHSWRRMQRCCRCG